MPINLRASVVSVRDDQPRSSDVFLLDTNVLYWTCYEKALSLASQQEQDSRKASLYSAYVNRALSVGATLTKCIVSLAELAHVIERDEWEIFRRSEPEIKLKDYRHQLDKRREVVEQFQMAWLLAEGITDQRSLPVVTDAHGLRETLQLAAIDSYDVFIYHAARSAQIRQILTDDADYGELPDVQIFTANSKLIDLARKQGKLIRR
ncbi:MAG: hypothetical protein CUN49_07400 [Candidatus Thermofonsia Clade 1 bacterium]|jgi:hypothetical protein|uniref:PIN domain-containing protein n=1 Tax=Candidatus Thermofonsia Clade 1 bacterium TaxID=2364210 RepID=A0A2M8PES6_9CHLR|nr:MAG: hypothetical protein CUN49_07400 [Candidatus Thermofonsia Clade 1 bacterium]